MFDSLRRDVRFGMRQLWKAPGFTATVVLTLAIGIGANLTIFLILYGVLLHPLPFPQPKQLVRVERLYPSGDLSGAYAGTRFLFMRRASRTLESAAAYDYVPNQMNLVQGNDAVPIMALGVSSDFFHLFGMPPQLGRAFQREDMNPNGPRTVVLSDTLWRQRFEGDPGILGRAITLGNQQFTVVGIADPRLLSVQSMQDVIRDSVSQQRFSMLLLCGFGIMSLLLGAAGLYGVMSYNVARRTKEIGIRMAVGAERTDILRLVLREAALLVGIGLGLGIAASLAGAHVLRSLLYGVAPRNPIALAAMTLLLLATGLFSAWWPARRGAATEPMQALRTE